MSFYFPRQNLYITVPYKNGATSALNFFVSVEKYLESSNCLIKELDHLDGLKINQDFGVHAKSGQYSAEPFRALAAKSNLEKADIRFFIIRDPYQRFSSFWHNRIMNGPDPYFAKIHSHLSAKYNLHYSVEVQSAAIEFLRNLSKPFTRPITNGHLWPQIHSMTGKWYDFIVETDDLERLPAILAGKSRNFRAFKDLDLPRLNISTNSEYPLLWNDEMKKNFRNSYAADIALYKGFKTENPNSADAIRFLKKRARSNLRIYDSALNVSRKGLKKVFR